MEKTILPVEAIHERDIDLIILEELNTDNSFCEWLINDLNFPKMEKNNGAWHSISDFGLGETDILFSYKSEDKTIFVLIENKLDANFQDKQGERYKRRALNYVDEKKCDLAYVILMAPKQYCENQNEFDNYITYEQIIERFKFIGTKQKIFKSKLLEIANEKLRRGYKPVNSEPVKKFWHSYWNYKEENFPEIYMKRPNEIIPANSDWPMLYDENLKGITFYHKWQQGNVDATFNNFPIEVEVKIKELLPENAKFVKHAKKFSIRYEVEKIDRFKDFELEKEKVEKALNVMNNLRKWLIENKKNWLQHFV